MQHCLPNSCRCLASSFLLLPTFNMWVSIVFVSHLRSLTFFISQLGTLIFLHTFRYVQILRARKKSAHGSRKALSCTDSLSRKSITHTRSNEPNTRLVDLLFFSHKRSAWAEGYFNHDVCLYLDGCRWSGCCRWFHCHHYSSWCCSLCGWHRRWAMSQLAMAGWLNLPCLIGQVCKIHI